MQLYQFNLPDATNAGVSYAGERLVWENEALKLAGGFTSLGEQQGAWLDPDGRPQWERMHVYQVAASEEAAAALEDKAFRLFPDQQAIFIATIGTARLAEPNHDFDVVTGRAGSPPRIKGKQMEASERLNTAQEEWYRLNSPKPEEFEEWYRLNSPKPEEFAE